MRPAAAALAKKNPAMRHHHFDHLQGLEATDNLVALLLAETGFTIPPPAVARWRKRLQDALLDCHFALGQTRFLLAGEPDQLAGQARSLFEAGGQVRVAVATVDSPQLEQLPAARVLVGDLEDAEDLCRDYDLLLTNGHGAALAHRCGKGLVVRGLPNWEEVGAQLKCDLLYEGGTHFLCEVANAAIRWRESGERHPE